MPKKQKMQIIKNHSFNVPLGEKEGKPMKKYFRVNTDQFKLCLKYMSFMSVKFYKINH